MDDVRLPDLEVIRRYSIAVRREHAPVAEVIEALRADLQKLSARGQRATQREVSDDSDEEQPVRRSVAQAKPAPARRPAPAGRPAASRVSAPKKRAKPTRKTYRSR